MYWNNMTDLQIKLRLRLVRVFWERSNSDCEGLCKWLGAKFAGKKWVASSKGLLVALERDLS